MLGQWVRYQGQTVWLRADGRIEPADQINTFHIRGSLHMILHSHANVVGDARKRLEADQSETELPFHTGPACRLPLNGAECGQRASHTHISPVKDLPT